MSMIGSFVGALAAAPNAKIHGLTIAKLKEDAAKIGCEVASIVAVDVVESGGRGFYDDGKTPIILFEPHIFWKRLKERGIDPNKYCNEPKYADILYPKWGTKPYGLSKVQHERLSRAVTIDRSAAMESASWGRYQILGMNWGQCGVGSLQDFINAIYTNDDAHLDLFINYVRSNHLDDELRGHDWAGFARGYNGALYVKNHYDEKLASAYGAAKLSGW